MPLSVGLLIGFGWGTYKLYRFFHPESDTHMAATVPSAAQKSGASPTPIVAEKQSVVPSFSVQWRIVGTTSFGSRQFVLVAGPTGRLRYEHPSNFMDTGSAMVGKIDGEAVTYFSGSLPMPVMAQQPGSSAR